MTYNDSDFEIEIVSPYAMSVLWRNKPSTPRVALHEISRKALISLSGIRYVGKPTEPTFWLGEYGPLSDKDIIAIYDSKGNELHRMELYANVLHRPTNQAVYGSPSQTTNYSNQGAASAGAIQTGINSGYVSYGPTASSYSPGPLIPYASSSAVQAVTLAQQKAVIKHAMLYGSGTGTATFTHTPDKEIYKKLPNEGMRAGEIVAYRCWPIKNGFLWSTAANRAWAPNEPMSAKEGHLEEGMGVFSFKEMSYAIQEFGHHGGYYSTEGMVFGSIWIWGNIVEHDTGYRAQYAAVRTLEFSQDISPQALNLRELQERYQVVGDPDERRPILQTDE